jgi:hypothetical protein
LHASSRHDDPGLERPAACRGASPQALKACATGTRGEETDPLASQDVAATAAAEEGRALLVRVRAEYLEMPGLKLTPAQAERLWGIDVRHCQRLLDFLVEAGFLKRSPDGSYFRVN